MDGFAVGPTCYRAVGDAVQAACSSVAGVTSAGVVSCEAPSFAAPVVSYTLVVDSEAGQTTRAATMQLQPCQPDDFTTWWPVIGLWFVALVTVMGVRWLYTRIFGGGTTS